jgi:hypothetical protein
VYGSQDFRTECCSCKETTQNCAIRSFFFPFRIYDIFAPSAICKSSILTVLERHLPRHMHVPVAGRLPIPCGTRLKPSERMKSARTGFCVLKTCDSPSPWGFLLPLLRATGRYPALLLCVSDFLAAVYVHTETISPTANFHIVCQKLAGFETKRAFDNGIAVSATPLLEVEVVLRCWHCYSHAY